MAILSIITDTAGQINVNPRLVKLVSNDNLAAILQPGYLPQDFIQTYAVFPTDIFEVSYAGNQIARFTPIINGNLITLQLAAQNIFTFNATVGFAALANAGKVVLVPSAKSEQFIILNMYLNGFGTNFAGGNRNGEVTDGTNVYSIIPAANMEALTNQIWSQTGLPLPASIAMNTPTVAGANLIFNYQGGTTDYTSGSLVITGLVLRVA